MPTSKTPSQVPPPAGSTTSSYTRFIPREELGSFSAWSPDSLQAPGDVKPAPGESPAGGGVHKPSFAERVNAQTQSMKPAGTAGAGKPVKPAADTSPKAGSKPAAKPAVEPRAEPVPAVSVEQVAKEARQAGYQDGYRDGLSAMESFKQTQTAQMAAFMSEQVGGVVAEMHMRLEAIEQQLSGRIAGVALELARQVVRSEIVLRPELVVAVAEEALSTLLETAKHVTVRMNPHDLELTHGLLNEKLQARGARAVADPNLTAGGCMVEADIAAVDASVEARWQHAASAMGLKLAWADHDHAPEPEVLDDDLSDGWPPEPGVKGERAP